MLSIIMLALSAQLVAAMQPVQERITVEDVPKILDEAVRHIRSIGYSHVFEDQPLEGRPFFFTEGDAEPFTKVVPGFERMPSAGRNFTTRQRAEVLQCEAASRQCRVDDDGIVLNATSIFFDLNPDGFSLSLNPIVNREASYSPLHPPPTIILDYDRIDGEWRVVKGRVTVY